MQDREDTLAEMLVEKTAAEKKLKRTLVATGGAVIMVIAIAVALVYKGSQLATARYEEKIEKISAEIESKNAIIKQKDEEIKKLNDELVLIINPVAPTVSLEVAKTKIQEIGELATMEYAYTDAGKFENSSTIWKIPLPLTEKSFIAKWDGVIKVGIDITRVKIDIIEGEKPEDKKIIVTLPKAKQLSHEIKMDSVETFDQKNGLFNTVEVKDVTEFWMHSKDAMEKRAKESNLYDKAEENAKRIIRGLILEIPAAQAYDIEVTVGK